MFAVVSNNVERSAGGMKNSTAIVAGGFFSLFVMIALIIPMALNACLATAQTGNQKQHATINFGVLRLWAEFWGLSGWVCWSLCRYAHKLFTEAKIWCMTEWLFRRFR